MECGAKDLKKCLVLHYESELHEHAFDEVNDDDDGEHSEVATRSSGKGMGAGGGLGQNVHIFNAAVVRLPHAFM